MVEFEGRVYRYNSGEFETALVAATGATLAAMHKAANLLGVGISEVPRHLAPGVARTAALERVKASQMVDPTAYCDTEAEAETAIGQAFQAMRQGGGVVQIRVVRQEGSTSSPTAYEFLLAVQDLLSKTVEVAG